MLSSVVSSNLIFCLSIIIQFEIFKSIHLEYLEIWFYTENYLRFTSDNYDPNQLHNKFANLTNATINKENIKEDTYEDN